MARYFALHNIFFIIVPLEKDLMFYFYLSNVFKEYLCWSSFATLVCLKLLLLKLLLMEELLLLMFVDMNDFKP